MRRSFYIHLAVFGIILTVPLGLPHLAHAATTNFFGPIIPAACNCATSVTANGVTVSSSAPAWGCVLQVFQNVLNALVSFSAVCISLYIAYAGVLFMSNPNSQESRTKARGHLLNAVIGLLIVMGSWLLVNSVMQVLYNPAAFGSTMPWQSILIPSDPSLDCLAPRNPGSLPGVVTSNTNTSVAAGGTGTTPGLTVVNTNTGVSGTPTIGAKQSGTRAQNADKYLAQICTAAAADGMSSQGNILAGVLGWESNGDPNAVSSAGAIGLMQLEPDTAAQYGVTACVGSSRSNPSATCVAALKDPQTNINAGVKYLSVLNSQTGGNTDNTIAAYNGGLKATYASTNCPGTTAWQCTANSGYAETRKYVPNVESVAQQTGSCS